MRLAFLLVFPILIYTSVYAQNYVADELLIQLRVEEDAVAFSRGIQGELAGKSFQLKKRLIPSMNIWLAKFDESQWKVKDAIAYFKRKEAVEIVQANHTNVIHRATQPNDQDYPAQWGLNGSGGGKISAPFAWDISTGGPTKLGDTVVVAVIDKGYDLKHYDLDYFRNYKEIPNNSIDDDGNGYVDDVEGWNAYASSVQIPVDDHGTHVAGIIGAKGNNNTGIAGVNWNCKILPIAGSSGTESVVIEAYGYALAMRKLYDATNGQKGAYVVATNSSFGVDFGNPSNYPIWCAFYDTLGTYGIVSAGATTNGSFDVDVSGDIPTTCPSKYMVAVSNISNASQLVGGYGGNSIDMAAPGTDVYSAVPGNLFANKTGTSMATPHVAGTIALMYSAMCTNMLEDLKNKPQQMSDTVLNALLNATDSLANLNGYVKKSARLNLYKALKNILNYDCIRTNVKVVSDTCGLCKGSILYSELEGAKPYTYSWKNLSVNSGNQNNLCQKEYIVTITDTNNFTRIDTIQINGNDSLKITYSVNHTSSSSNSDAGIDMSVSGGVQPYSFQWSNSATSEDLQNIGTGVYQVVVKDKNGCQKNLSIPVYVTSINETIAGSIQVYPNPFKEELFVRIESELEEITIDITDVVGKEIMHKSYLSGNGVGQINTSQLFSGIYFLKIRKGNKTIAVQKIIKN